MRITASLFSSVLIAFWPSAPSVAYGQAYEIHNNFIESEFDHLLLQRQSIPEEKYVVQALEPYFSKFCGTNDFSELLKSNFICSNFICKTSRFKYLLGYYTPNIARYSWNIDVEFNMNDCPKFSVKFGYHLNQGYQYRK